MGAIHEYFCSPEAILIVAINDDYQFVLFSRNRVDFDAELIFVHHSSVVASSDRFENKQTMGDLPKFALDYIDEIVKKEGFLDHQIEVEPASKHGDNFLGIVSRVIVRGTRLIDGKATEDRLDLICKLPPDNAARRQEFRSSEFFTREAFAYNVFLPTIVDFQNERGLSETEGFFSFPKCYKAEANEETDQFVVIMEDLGQKGFIMWPKAKPVPYEQSRLIFVELGKLHGVSYALKDQKPEVFAKFRKLDDLFKIFLENENMHQLFGMGYDRAIGALKSERDIEAMTDVKENFVEKFFKCSQADDFGIVGHGDCWTNNILCHYENGVS